MDNIHNGGASPPPFPVPPIATTMVSSSSSSSHTSRRTSHSSSMHSRRSLKSLEHFLVDHRDPKKLQKLVHKLYEQLRFEKDRADYADRQASEAMSYLRSICEEKLRALCDISRLEEELKSDIIICSIWNTMTDKFCVGCIKFSIMRLRKRYSVLKTFLGRLMKNAIAPKKKLLKQGLLRAR